MSEYVNSFPVGAATVTVINIGNLRGGFAVHEDTPEIPIQSVLIQTAETRVLVDTCAYEIPAASPYALPGYQPPPGVVERLDELGVTPEQIEHVIFTHAHWDHYNGATERRGDGYVPIFPNARHHLGRADWDMVQPDLANPDSLTSRTLAAVMRAGQLELADGNRQISDDIEIVPAPGETPGHQMVRVSSQGQTLYCIGDLYHFASEVEYADDMPNWADRAAMAASRVALVDAALAESAKLIVTHIAGVGRLERTASGAVWRTV